MGASSFVFRERDEKSLAAAIGRRNFVKNVFALIPESDFFVRCSFL
jgi:hypothetical protein